MTLYADVVVNVPGVQGVFSYHLTGDLADEIKIGDLVLVPFGGRTVQGVIAGFPPGVVERETKPVLRIVDPGVSLTRQQIALAEQMAHDWLAPMANCIGLMMPPGVEQQADVLYTPRGRLPETLSTTQNRLMNLLYKRGPLRGAQIDRAMPRVNWRSAARALTQKGLLQSEPVLTEPRVRPRQKRTVQLAVSAEAAAAALPGIGRAGALQRRQDVLRFLIAEPGPVEAAWIYAETGANATDLKALAERGLVLLGESEVWRNPIAADQMQPNPPPELTADQERAWNELRPLLDASFTGQIAPPILLHGVTGSGKTEIYLRSVQHAIGAGRQCIILVPEIALTPQTIRRFAGRFPEITGVIHSGLSDGERYDTWRRARLGELSLVIGPRSALFTPFERLGLIVVDECHDDSYYQAEAAPHFHARDLAASYARQTGSICLLGSATPDVGSMHRCRDGQWKYLHLPNRILAHRQAVKEQAKRMEEHPARDQADDLPPVSIVDMRAELQAGNRSIFSRELQAAIQKVLDHNLQAILFLNRRGSATYVFCRDCGFTLKCPNCEIPLTYHDADAKLRCHYCRYTRNLPEKCPACAGTRIRQFGTGTQKVETEVQALFPGVRTIRWDWETTRRKGAHEAILNRFAAHQADVLVGTQMLAKGLDLPLVTLVGVVLADVGLNLPDYRAGERTFQVLTQVAGRAGRSPLGGKVVLQTFQPEHYVIRSAAGHDYLGFFEQEIAYRKALNYPPFTRLVRLEYRHFDARKVEASAGEMSERLRAWIDAGGHAATRLIGPAPCFFGRVSGMHRWQIVVIGPDPAGMLRGRDLGEWKIEVNPPNLL